MQHLSGHLELTCAADDQGRSFIRRQSFSAPFHLSKPYWDKQALIVQIANPTAGLFSGDRLRSEITVEPGARLLLTTPSAGRLHTMPSGHAAVRQTYHVASGAWLEIRPELFIPQAGCRYRQTTRIEVAAGGSLFFVETMAPGRVARGEVFQFTELDWETNILLGNKLIVRERFVLRPGDNSLAALNQSFPGSYYATCFLLTDRLEDHSPCWSNIAGLNTVDVWCATSRLVTGGWSIKILARDSIALRETCENLRNIFAEQLPALRSNPRKL